MNLREKNRYALEELSLFDGIEKHNIEGLLICLGSSIKEYKKHEFVILDEEKITNVCVLLSGCIHMLKEDSNGHLTLITYMQPGELFGESFALRKLPETKVSFLASQESAVLFLPMNRVLRTCDNNCKFHKKIIENMYELLSQKNLSLMQKIDTLSRSSMREKIICYLELQLSKTQNKIKKQKNKRKTVTLPLNKSELAHYLNINRTSLCRELASMEKDGIISFSGNHYILHNNS